jgi:RNA polymerase sigma factor (sigma-70 family)
MVSDDMVLVREYASERSERAFETLVARHIRLVHSVAMRQTRDADLAEEVTQAVFIILAKKAPGLGDSTILPGWLCRTARNVSANALTTRRRRQEREQEAHMRSLEDGPGPEVWAQVAPLLDQAMAELGEKDHDAIVLRYFEGRSFGDVGRAMDISEDAAKKRTSRALERLRSFFQRAGLSLSTDSIAGAVAAHSVQAVPAGLVASVTATAFKGFSAKASTTALIENTLKIMAWTQLKTAAVVAAVVLITGSAFIAIHRPKAAEPASPFAFAGYATPEASIRSMLWAASTGDIEKFLAAFTPEESAKFRGTVLAGKSADRISQDGKALARAMVGYKIVGKDVVSDDEIHVEISAPPAEAGLKSGKATVILRRVAGEWKRDGSTH